MFTITGISFLKVFVPQQTPGMKKKYMINMTFHHTLTYGLLSLSLIALWLPAKETKRFPIRLWHIFCVAALGWGLLFGNVQLFGLLSIAIFGASCYSPPLNNTQNLCVS